jgi:hypothetical protein
LQGGRIDIAYGNQFARVPMRFKRTEMIVGNAAAADQGEFDFAV